MTDLLLAGGPLRRRRRFEHLGELAEVDPFPDDAQIRVPTFEFRSAGAAAYTVELDLVAPDIRGRATAVVLRVWPSGNGST